MDNHLELTDSTRRLFSRRVVPVTRAEAEVIESLKQHALSDLNILLHVIFLSVMLQPAALYALLQVVRTTEIALDQYLLAVRLIVLLPVVAVLAVHVSTFVWIAKWRRQGKPAVLKGLRNRASIAVLPFSAIIYSLVRPLRYSKLVLSAFCVVVGHIFWISTPFSESFKDSTIAYIVIECLIGLAVIGRAWAGTIDARAQSQGPTS